MLDTKSTAGNVNSLGLKTLKGILKQITSKKAYLLEYAKSVDPLCRSMLDGVVPDCVTFSMKKQDICRTLLGVYDIVWFLLPIEVINIARGKKLSMQLLLLVPMID